jgi:UDP-N-acetyl-D-mannosaminuronic acid dehydrogenase
MTGIEESSPKIAIVGLGYVGLTLGVALALRGLEVVGVERRREIVDLTNAGTPHFSEEGLNSALEVVLRDKRFSAVTSLDDVEPCDFYIITVGTPLLPDTQRPRLDMIEAASKEVARHFEDNATIILRSTVRIGTTEKTVRPILAETGKRFYLAMCPERTLEGNALRELTRLPQIIGAQSVTAANRAASLFGRLTHTVVRVKDAETAEMIKLVDNTYRDVSFAFANEVARACDALGINANEVIEYGKLGYARTQVAKPGLVGGPCLEKDPHILRASLLDHDVSLEVTTASRLVNERQPAETVERMMRLLSESGAKPPYTVAVAGIAFKGVPETDDLRGSMSLSVIEALRSTGRVKSIRVYDPVVPVVELEKLPYDVSTFDSFAEFLSGTDLLVIGNNHPAFSKVSIDKYLQSLASHGIIYDYWNNLEHEPSEKREGRYFTVGNAGGKVTR